jgi:hypothetical protein
MLVATDDRLVDRKVNADECAVHQEKTIKDKHLIIDKSGVGLGLAFLAVQCTHCMPTDSR